MLDAALDRDGRTQIALRQERLLVLEVEHEGSMTGADRAKVAELLRNTKEISGSVDIQNVNQRLKLIYGEESSLSLDETGRGTILARIRFPLAGEGEGDEKTPDRAAPLRRDEPDSRRLRRRGARERRACARRAQRRHLLRPRRRQPHEL